MLKRNLIANYIGQGWTALMGLAFVPLYIKYLGIESYGLIGLFAVLTAWLSLLDMGMTPTLSREMARFTGGSHSAQSIRDLLRTIEVITFSIAMVIAGGIALGSNWIATYWLSAEELPIQVVSQAFAIMGLVTALRFAESIYRSSIVGLQRQVLFNMVNSSLATLRGLGAVGILAWVSPTIQAFFLWQGLISILTLVTLAAATYACLPSAKRIARFSFKALCSVRRFAGGVLLITLVSLLNTQIDKVFASKLLSLREFGYYSLAIQLSAIIFLTLNPVTQSFYPRLAQLYANRQFDRFVDTFHVGAQISALMAGTVSMILLFFHDHLLGIWLVNHEVESHVGLLLVLAVIGNLFNSFLYMPMQALLSFGATRLPVISGSISALISTLLLTAFVPLYGVVAALLIWIIIRVVQFVLVPYFVFRKIMPNSLRDWYVCDIIYPITVLALTFTAGRYIFDMVPAMIGVSSLIYIFGISLAAILFGIVASGQLRPLFFSLLKVMHSNLKVSKT